MATAATEPGSPKHRIRRNIALLSGPVAANAAMLQLSAAVAAPSRTRRAPIGELLRRAGVVPALVAGQASWAPTGTPDASAARWSPTTSTAAWSISTSAT